MTAIVGLTGGIGAGKSFVGKCFESFGARRVDADQLARDAVAVGSPVLAAIAERFGPSVLLDNGELDRPALGRRVFASPEDKLWLEQQIHPYVRQQIVTAIAQAHADAIPMLVIEIPLLFEGGMHTWLPYTVLVTADDDIRVGRVMARDHLPEADIRQRMAHQMPESQKRALATLVIENNQTPEVLQKQALAVYNQITKMSGN